MKKIYVVAIIFAAIAFIASCKKTTVDPVIPTPVDPCLSKTIVVSGTTTTSSPSSANGSITASATGSTGFMYSIENGAFQASGTFTNLAAGNYTVRAKDGDGCSNFKIFTVSSISCPNIALPITTTPTIKCENTGFGTITFNPSGGVAPYTYSITPGVFQSSASFTNLVFGTYNYTVKDALGCTKDGSLNIGYGSRGPKFASVVGLLEQRCNSCHGGSNNQGNFNFSDDCSIISKAALINLRVVVQGTMPQSGPLSATEKAIITNWINAGGSYNN